MPITTPSIDDRRYDDILAEIRTRIPRYTPEWRAQWTALNDSDPGMILAQTFAWLSEMLLFRMEQVPELHYLKFLQLIGIELLPALPARAEVSFAVEDAVTTPTVIVPPRSSVSAAGEDGTPVLFETDAPLTAITAQLRAVQSYDGASYNDASASNADPASSLSGIYPFGEAPREGGALLLGFGFPDSYPTPNVFAPVSIDLAIFAREAESSRLIHQCGSAETRAYASATLAWEGFDGSEWQPLDAINDETLALTRSGHVVVRVPPALALQRVYLGTYDPIDPITKQPRPPLFWIRARLARSQYEMAPVLAAIRTNTVPVLQAQTVRGEVLGGTSGARNQTWQLENRPVLRSSLRIEINEGPGDAARPWAVVDDLFGASPTDEQLAVNWTSGEIRAGDGERGQIPVANAGDPDANVIAAEYRYGGGLRGNVAAGEIRNLLTPVDGIDGAKTTNLFAASGGSDEERLEEAKARARLALRARDRAVTAEDFELLARQAGNVRRAKALPLTHPHFAEVNVPGVVTVIIVPDSRSPRPRPSDGLLRTVCAFLDARRLLTTELFVIAPQYVEVSIEAELIVRDDADPGRVKEAVNMMLATYLDPLRGGDDGLGWPFGGAIRYSKILQRIFSVDGVDSIPSATVILDGERQPECRDVPIPALALASTGQHMIVAAAARELEEL